MQKKPFFRPARLAAGVLAGLLTGPLLAQAEGR